MLGAKGGARSAMGFDKQDNEVTCPASEEGGRKTTCEKCALCAGAGKVAKSIIIRPHGSGKKHFNSVYEQDGYIFAERFKVPAI